MLLFNVKCEYDKKWRKISLKVLDSNCSMTININVSWICQIFVTDIFAISATFCMSELDEVDRMTLRQHVHFMIHFFRSRLKVFDLGEYDARVKLFSKEGAMITCIISKVIFCMSKRTILSVCKPCDTINFGKALPAFSMWPKTKKTLRPLHLKNHKVYQ